MKLKLWKHTIFSKRNCSIDFILIVKEIHTKQWKSCVHLASELKTTWLRGQVRSQSGQLHPSPITPALFHFSTVQFFREAKQITTPVMRVYCLTSIELFVLFCICDTPGGIQGLLLARYSGITPGRLGAHIRYWGSNSSRSRERQKPCQLCYITQASHRTFWVSSGTPFYLSYF